MIYSTLPVIVVEKVSFVCRTRLLRACEIRSQYVSFASPRSLKLSLSHSIVLRMLLRISSGFTGFLSTPNGQNLTRLYHFYTFTYIPRIMIIVYEIIYFWQTQKRTMHSWHVNLNTSELLPDHGDAGAAIDRGRCEFIWL